MVTAFDRIVIGVADVATALEEYAVLMGMAPASFGPEGSQSRGFSLPNTVIELRESDRGEPCVQGIVLCLEAGADEATALPDKRGLDIDLSDGRDTSELRSRSTVAAAMQAAGIRVDHLVLRTADADACIELFSDRLGIRLALDKTFPEWGGRMLFFRAGKLTLEVIEPERDPPEADAFWGIAYQCDDLASAVESMQRRGVEVSPIRTGRKPGTLVATVKSHCLGIPTLLLQPA